MPRLQKLNNVDSCWDDPSSARMISWNIQVER